MEPRSYQSAAIDAARREVASGNRHVVIVSPTGSGKTFTGGLIVRAHLERAPTNRVAWFAHRKELVEQAADALRALGVRVGAFGLDPEAPAQITSVQTVLARGEAPPATLFVPDEAHHYVSDEWKRIPELYRAQGAITVGLTATPERDDGRGLDGAFDAMVVAAQIGDLIREGHLVPCEHIRPRGTVPKGKIAMWPDEAYLRYSPGESAVVFAPHVKAATEYSERFARANITCDVVHGDMPDAERETRLAAFKSGALRVLCNVNVLTEGWDAPICSAAILARRIGSASLYLQCGGRALRLYDGKRSAKIIDLTGVSLIHGALDEERVFSLDGRVRRKGEEANARYCRVCGAIVPSGPCPNCGIEGGDMHTPESARMTLEKYAWAAAVPTDRRVAMLARWYVQAQGKQHKLASAHYKFQAVFKVRPSGEIQEAARAAMGRLMG